MRTSIALVVLVAGCATPDKYYPPVDGGVSGADAASVPPADAATVAGDAHNDAPSLPVADSGMDANVTDDAAADRPSSDIAVDERVLADISAPDAPPPACALDERKCDNDTALKCRADRSGFEVAEVCSGRVPYCYQGQCTGCGGGKGVCGDGLCPMNCPNETPTGCFMDCATLPEGEARAGSSGVIPKSNLWGECGPYQAVIGILSPTPISVTCSFDRAEYGHRASDCRAVDYVEDPATPNEFVSTCRDDELVAGMGKTVPGQYLCCKAGVHHRNCQRQLSCRTDQYAADVIASEAVSGSLMLWCCSP